jgi:hypothetical protein
VRLAEGDATGILAHLNAKVEAEEAEVAHVKDLLHFRLERLHFTFLCAGDDEVIDVDTDEQDRAPTALSVHRRLVSALLEAHVLERGV